MTRQRRTNTRTGGGGGSRAIAAARRVERVAPRRTAPRRAGRQGTAPAEPGSAAQAEQRDECHRRPQTVAAPFGVGNANQARPSRGLVGRGEAGLATLGWLLVTAAVGSVAALAVVVVQSLVADVGGSVASYSARLAAANLMAAEIHREAQASAPRDALEADRLNRRLGSRCRRVPMVFADTGGTTHWKPGIFAGAAERRSDPPRWAALPSCAFAGPR